MFLLKEFFAGMIYFLFSKSTRKGSILMYHSIGHNKKFSTVTPQNFEKQLRYLKNTGYIIVPLSQLISMIESKQNLAKHVSLTFDDGYEDFYTVAYPLLMKYQIPATVFVATGYIGTSMTTSQGRDTFKMMSADQIREVAHGGLVSVMPHTVTHTKLTKISHDEAKDEINSSRNALEQITNMPARIFAYPAGKYTQEIVEYLREDKKWLSAVTVNQGLVAAGDDLFILNRNSVDSEVGMQQFKIKISRGIEVYLGIKKWLR